MGCATLFVLLLCLLPAVAAARPPWEQMGGSLNNAGAQAAADPAMAVVAGAPTVTWRENSIIYAKQWNGAAWSALGASVAASDAAAQPTIAADATSPWIAYTSGATTNVFVKQWTGAAWAARGGSLNVVGTNAAVAPSIAMSSTGTPYVAWIENSWDLYVKYWNGASWVGIGGDFLGAGFGARPVISIASDGTPYVIYQYWDGAHWTPQVRKWTGAAWALVGPATIQDIASTDTYDVDLSVAGTTPYATWREWDGANYSVFVKQWTGAAWTRLSAGLAPYTAVNFKFASQPRIIASGTNVYVAWAESNGLVDETVVYRWDGATWKQLSGGLNIDPTLDSCSGNCGRDIALVGTTPWVVWPEPNASAVDQIYARRYVPTTTMVGPLTGVTITALNAQVRLDWTNPGDADLVGVKIYRSAVEGTLGSLVQTIAAPGATWTDSGVTNQTRYFYTLVAYNAVGDERETVYDTGESTIGPGVYGGGVVGDGTKLWTFGGCTFCTTVNDIWEYDPATDTSTKKTGVTPTARVRSRAVWIPGAYNKAYVFGGEDPTATRNVFTYVPGTDTVASLGNVLPAARTQGAATYAANTGLAYYLGGKDGAGVVRREIYSFNPATNTMADTGILLPQPMYYMSAVYWPADGCIYMFGGNDGTSERADIVKYCPAAGTIANLTTVLPTAHSEIALSRTADDIVLVGGGVGLPYTTNIYSFRPATQTLLKHPVSLRVPFTANTPEAATTSKGTIYMVEPYTRSRKITQLNIGSLVAATPSNPPNTPTNTTPASNGTSGTAAVGLAASAFSDPNVGDTHGASQWQVRTNAGTYAAPAFDSGIDTVNLTTRTTSGLADGTYWFQVRYRDQNGVWSAYSAETRFYVDTVNPSVPALVSPAAADTVTGPPSLVATYSDPAPASPGRVNFQVCSDAACTSVVGSGNSASGIATGSNGSWTTGALAGGTWYWRARNEDGAAHVSAWSATRSFVVVSVSAVTPTTGPQGRRGLVVQITGTGFQAGAVASFSGTGISVVSTAFVSATRVDATIDITGAAATTARDVTVTNTNTSTGTGTSLFTVTTSSITLTLSTLGFVDAARDTTVPYGMDMGMLVPAQVRAVGPGGSGQTLAGPAMRLSITSDTTSQIEVQAAQMTDGSNPIPLANTEYKASASGTWLALPAASTMTDTGIAPGSSTWDYDYRLTMPGAQPAGTYTQTITWTVVAQP